MDCITSWLLRLGKNCLFGAVVVVHLIEQSLRNLEDLVISNLLTERERERFCYSLGNKNIQEKTTQVIPRSALPSAADQ